ncbi:MAG: hypothetical protein GF411_12530 [Candidatus Lokiarchaeota archaeon]|nr:hypothetical protein [Candidatus Lokiarchaeota archaeon]
MSNKVSFIADNLILLRYIEYAGAIGRAINVLKSRGSFHSKIIRKFEISKEGVEIGNPIIALTGFMTGNPVYPREKPVKVLSPEVQYVFSLIGRKESISFDTLLDDTGFKENRLIEILGQLIRTDHIVEEKVASEKCYRITI